MLLILALETQEDPWALLACQSRLVGKVQASETLSQRKWMVFLITPKFIL